MPKNVPTGLLNGFFLVLVLALCFYKAPKAWELRYPSKASASHDAIPYLRNSVKSTADWYLEPHKRLKEYNTTVREIAQFADSYKQVRPIYRSLKHVSYYIDKSCFVAQSPEHMSKNRYSSLLPFDETRSCKEIPGFYVNANDIYTPVQSYMVSQGPLEQTIPDFWRAVLNQNSELIVTLVMAEEEGKEKCASFWTRPTTEVDGWTITKQSERQICKSKIIPSHRLVEREFLAKNGHEMRSIKQIHYENWPDGKTPDLDLFVQLLDLVDSLQPQTRVPIVVHCSAGIGRSGTFVAAHSLRKELRLARQNKKLKNQEIRLNIPKAIFYLRCQRMGLVGTSKQYQIIYQALAREHRPRNHPLFLLVAPY